MATDTETRDPRPEKVAVVAEVKERLEAADAAVLTDYRGIDVAAMAQLRRALTDAGGELKIYKNTLVRFAVQELGLDVEDLLVGPTAIAFVPPKADGTPGDAVTVAKALKDFAKGNEHLIIKGGLLGDKALSVDEIKALAEVAPREVLLAQLAGAFAAPMQQFAGLLKAVPQSFAYGLAALIEQGGGPDAPAAEAAPAEAPAADEAPAEEAPAEPDADGGDETEAKAEPEAPAEDAPAEAEDAGDEASEPVAEHSEEPAEGSDETEAADDAAEETQTEEAEGEDG
ncbi:50S ribosomal protein L10 [cyanobacterium TDX16]|nr:50S ribosomal protein L10 [cyanobacterium TDX16]